MALITCKVCGKKFSDTLERCVHCNTIFNKELVIEEKQKCCDKIDFYSLEVRQRHKLEEEFVCENKEAFKYLQKTTYDKFASVVSKITLLMVFLYFCINIVLFAFVDIGNIEIEKEKYLIFSAVALIFAFVIMLFSNIIEIIIVVANKNSYKKYVYIKEYQKWLLEKKDIMYEPFFKKKVTKRFF